MQQKQSTLPMALFRSWPTYAVIAAIILYMLFTGDEPTKIQSGQVANSSSQGQPSSPSRPPAQDAGYLQPVVPGAGYPNAGLGMNPYQPNLYRYRTQGTEQQPANRYAESRSTIPSYPGMSGPQYPPVYTGLDSPANRMQYRFRPIDEARQSKRWTGNYAPGNYAHGAVKSERLARPDPPGFLPYQPPLPGTTQPYNPLWADNLPERR